MPPARATVIISDSTFNTNDWSAAIYSSQRSPDEDGDGAGDSSGSDGVIHNTGQNSIDGDPAPSRFLDYETGTAPGPASIERIAIFDAFIKTTYTPSTQGAILSLDYSESRRNSSGSDSPTIGAYYGLMQDGKVYEQAAGDMNFDNTTWITTNISGLVSADFIDSTDGVGNPDFTSSGGEITFGYIRWNGTGGPTRINEVYTDNFEWTITSSIPEPAITGLVYVGTLMLLALRRRRIANP